MRRVLLKVMLFALVMPAFEAVQYSFSATAAKKTVWVNRKPMSIDPRVWSYYAPGVFRGNALLPGLNQDGILIKYPDNQKKRVTFLIRSDDLVTSASDSCKKLIPAFKANPIEAGKDFCFFEAAQPKGDVLLEMVYEDFRSLKLVTFSVVVPSARKNEIKDDFSKIRKDLL